MQQPMMSEHMRRSRPVLYHKARECQEPQDTPAQNMSVEQYGWKESGNHIERAITDGQDARRVGVATRREHRLSQGYCQQYEETEELNRPESKYRPSPCIVELSGKERVAS